MFMWPFTRKKKVEKKEVVAEEVEVKEEVQEPVEEPAEEIVVESTVEEKDETGASRKPIYRLLYDKENKKWLIKKDGAKRTIDSFKTKEEALGRIQQLAANKDLKFIVHKKDGKFQKKR